MRRTMPQRGLVLGAVLVLVTAMAPSIASARAWLGVYTQEITSELRDALDLSGDGVLVNRVVPDSPADRAGLVKGDVIVSLNSRSVDSPGRLSELVGDAREGQDVALSIVRKGDRRTLNVRLGTRPGGDDEEMTAPEAPEPPTPPTPGTPRAPRAPRTMRWYSSDDVNPDEIRDKVREVLPNFDFHMAPEGGANRTFVMSLGRGRLGVRVEALNEDLASALGSPGTKGVLVVEVLKDTPAEKAGLKAGDVITSVKDRAVYDADDLVKALRDESGSVELSVTRKGSRRTVEATLEDAPRVMRWNSGDGPMGMGRTGDKNKVESRMRLNDDADREGLRKEIDELRQQLRELRQQMEDRQR